MSKFQSISLAEMREFLQPVKGWQEVDLPGVEEVVFDYALQAAAHIHIRVYSSILKLTGVARPVGGDAIRVCAVNLQTDRGWIAASRVHRVEGWRENLKDRVTFVISEARGRLQRQSIVSEPMAVSAPVEPKFSAIVALLTAASAHLKFPALRVESSGGPLRLGRMGEKSRTPGGVRITAADQDFQSRDYFGCILPDGSLRVNAGPRRDEILQILADVEAAPVKVLAEQGRLTGRCCFCNQALTDERSTAVGYGATCADHFHLPYPTRSGAKAATAQLALGFEKVGAA